MTVFISSGPGQTTVTDVVGEPVGQAKHDLKAAGFKIAVVHQIECTNQDENNVVQSQDPPGNSQAAQGSTVEITVAKYRPDDPSCVAPPGST